MYGCGLSVWVVWVWVCMWVVVPVCMYVCGGMYVNMCACVWGVRVWYVCEVCVCVWYLCEVFVRGYV